MNVYHEGVCSETFYFMYVCKSEEVGMIWTMQIQNNATVRKTLFPPFETLSGQESKVPISPTKDQKC